MAEIICGRLREARFFAAILVRELRQRWGPNHDVLEVHHFVREVVCCLLWHDDIEVGELRHGIFVPWNLDSEESYDRFDQEVMAMDTFLDEDDRYVFQMKLSPSAESSAAADRGNGDGLPGR
jgi:hypothetical protein